MTERDAPPGYDVVELLGYGSGGEVWLARERVTGAPVALKRLRAGADLAARDRLRREAAVLAGVDHPHVVRLRSVHGDGEDLVLVLDLAPGGSLARLLATRRRLAAGEVVTLAVPLAQALAAVHAQGLVHGDVTPANVLFAADGRPLLSDLGVARLLGAVPGEVGGTPGYQDPAVVAGAGPGPASDVHGLAATCLAALTGLRPYDVQGRRVPLPAGTHAALAAALEPALAPVPADRPTAAALAVAVFDAATAEAVRFDRSAGPLLAGSDPGEPVAAPTHQVAPGPRAAADPVATSAGRAARRRSALPRGALRRPGRTVTVTLAAVLTLALAAATGIAWAGADDGRSAGGVAAGARPGVRKPAATASPTAASSAAATPSVASRAGMPAEGWAGALAALDQARSQAFATGDVGRLLSVYAPAAPALRRDRRALHELTRAGLRALGLRLTTASVRLRARTAGRVQLAVTDRLQSYRLVDAGGHVVQRRPGRGERSWTVVLARSGDRWRVYDVVRG